MLILPILGGHIIFIYWAPIDPVLYFQLQHTRNLIIASQSLHPLCLPSHKLFALFFASRYLDFMQTSMHTPPLLEPALSLAQGKSWLAESPFLRWDFFSMDQVLPMTHVDTSPGETSEKGFLIPRNRPLGRVIFICWSWSGLSQAAGAPATFLWWGGKDGDWVLHDIPNYSNHRASPLREILLSK